MIKMIVSCVGGWRDPDFWEGETLVLPKRHCIIQEGTGNFADINYGFSAGDSSHDP